MIARIWHGWTTLENADSYEELLRRRILPSIQESHRSGGYKGAQLLRRQTEDEVEFVTVTFFESLDSVRVFAGEDYEVAVVPTPARALLERFDERSTHYQLIESSLTGDLAL